MTDVLEVLGGVVGKTLTQVSSDLSGPTFPDLYNWGTNTGAMRMALGNLSTWLNSSNVYTISKNVVHCLPNSVSWNNIFLEKCNKCL